MVSTSPASPMTWLPTWMKCDDPKCATSFQPSSTPMLLCRYSAITMPTPRASSRRPRSSTPLSRRNASRATIPPCKLNSAPPAATRASGRSINTNDPTTAATTGTRIFQSEQGLPKNRQIATSDAE